MYFLGEKERENFHFSLDKVQFRKWKKNLALSDTFFIFFTDIVDSYVKKKEKRTHAVRQIPKNTYASISKHSSCCNCIWNSALLSLALFLITFLFCNIRDTLTRGSFHFINIFVQIILRCYWKAPAPSENQCLKFS